LGTGDGDGDGDGDGRKPRLSKLGSGSALGAGDSEKAGPAYFMVGRGVAPRDASLAAPGVPPFATGRGLPWWGGCARVGAGARTAGLELGGVAAALGGLVLPRDGGGGPADLGLALICGGRW